MHSVIQKQRRARKGLTSHRYRTITTNKGREILVKLSNPESAALLRPQSSEEICRKINEVIQEKLSEGDRAPQVIAAKQLKSGDIMIHTASTADAKIPKARAEDWVETLGTRARVLQLTYGVIAYAVSTSREDIDPGKSTPLNLV